MGRIEWTMGFDELAAGQLIRDDFLAPKKLRESVKIDHHL